MNGKSIIANLTPYKQGMQIEEVKRKYGLDKIVKLASNENPFGYTDKLKHQLESLLNNLEIYPDGYTLELRNALATKLDIHPEQLVFGSGSDEIVQMICRAYLYPGVNTLMATPTFPQYKHNALIEGAHIKEVPTRNGYNDLKAMLQYIDDKTAVVWICSPNNPTGTVTPKEDFYHFMENCPEDILVVLDEAYYEYVSSDKNIDILKELHNYSNLIVLRTFSKAYGLAAMRIGYGIAQEQICDKLNVVRAAFNTSSIAQKAALIALNDDEFIEQTVTQNNENKVQFKQFLDRIGWQYEASETNFLLVSTPISGEEVFQYLLANGFIVRPGESLGCPNTIRITIGKRKDMEDLQVLINKLHEKLKRENKL